MRDLRTRLACLALLLSSLGLQPAHAIDLDAAYRSAQSYDAELLAAQAARLEAEEGIPVARAALLPQLAYTFQRNKANTTNYLLSTGQKRDSGDYFSESESLTLRQPIYRKSAWAALDSAQAQSEAADANYRKEEQNLALRVVTTYLDVLLAREGVTLAKAETKALEALTTLAEGALRSGTGTRTDVDDARARRDMARARVSESTMRLSQASQEFRTVTNIEADRLPAIDPRLLSGATMAITGRTEWLARIEAASPELQSLRKQLEAADADVEKARGGHYPNIDMIVSRQEGQSETNTTVGSGYRTDYIGVQLSLPLVSGFGVMAQVRQTQARTERVRQTLESTRRKLLAEAERLYFAVELGVEKAQAVEQAIVSAEQALISAQKGVAAGTRTVVDVLDSEHRVFMTKRDQAFSIFELASNRLKLLALADAINDDVIKHASIWLAAAKR